MKIYLLRHGQKDWNLEGRLQGRKDIPLNDCGKEQMFTVAEFLQVLSFQPHMACNWRLPAVYTEKMFLWNLF